MNSRPAVILVVVLAALGTGAFIITRGSGSDPAPTAVEATTAPPKADPAAEAAAVAPAVADPASAPAAAAAAAAADAGGAQGAPALLPQPGIAACIRYDLIADVWTCTAIASEH